MTMLTKERLIDKLRDELYVKHNWTGETAVKFMVPIILAIRFKYAFALAQNATEDDAIFWALGELRQGGKTELDTTLTQVSHQYQNISPLLQETLREMITFVMRQPDGIIYDLLDYFDRNKDLLRALRDEDFIGTLFERSVSDAFRGDDGRFFTPRNIILIVREIMRLLLEKQNPNREMADYTVCDPCCGSARFLIYWSEHLTSEIKQEQPFIKRPDLLAWLKETAERTLFGADIHEDTAAYGCLNMLLHGDGASNIAVQDSLDHFGFFADMPLLREFAAEFQRRWDAYNSGPARQRGDIEGYLNIIEERKAIVADLLTVEEIDLSTPKWLDVMRIIRALLRADQKYPTEWDSTRALQRRFKRQTVFETMLDEWAGRNPDIANGFDVLITNPPFGRQSDLMIDDPFLLSQYRLATEVWVGDMNKGMTERVLTRTLAKGKSLHAYYIGLVRKHFAKEYVEDVDEVPFDQLPMTILRRLAEENGIETKGQSKAELAAALNEKLGRRIVEREDDVQLSDLSASEANRVCSQYLYEDNKPGEALTSEIVAHFGKEWLTVEDIEGPAGYASKVTLIFNGEPHTIYYDDAGKPIIYKSPLPKQVLFVEQFLRMVKQGGKVFTVLDTGVLSNLDDEYIRRFMFKSAQWWVTVEFPHGAFKAAKANVKTAVVLLERRKAPGLDYEIFGSLPKYLGYDPRKKDTPPIFENDLGRVVCDFNLALNGQRLCLEDCPWTEKRFCRFGDEIGMDRAMDELLSQYVGGADMDEYLGVEEEIEE